MKVILPALLSLYLNLSNSTPLPSPTDSHLEHSIGDVLSPRETQARPSFLEFKDSLMRAIDRSEDYLTLQFTMSYALAKYLFSEEEINSVSGTAPLRRDVHASKVFEESLMDARKVKNDADSAMPEENERQMIPRSEGILSDTLARGEDKRQLDGDLLGAVAGVVSAATAVLDETIGNFGKEPLVPIGGKV